MTDDLNNYFLLYKKLESKAFETRNPIDFNNAASLIDLIKSQYLTDFKIMKQHRNILEDFTFFQFNYYGVTKETNAEKKFREYCDYLTTIFPDRFEGRYYYLIYCFMSENSPSWEVKPLRRAFQMELEKKPVILERFYYMYENIYKLAQIVEKNHSKLANSLYSIIVDNIIQEGFDYSNLDNEKKEEILEKINEIYIISKGKLSSSFRLF